MCAEPFSETDVVSVRRARPGDREGLQGYFRSLSLEARYNRFLGAGGGFSDTEVAEVVEGGDGGRFALVATRLTEGTETIVGEGCLALRRDEMSVELALSVGDRWRRGGVGKALLSDLEQRACALGVARVFGDVWATNRPVISFARQAGYLGAPSPGGWTLARFEKPILPPT